MSDLAIKEFECEFRIPTGPYAYVGITGKLTIDKAREALPLIQMAFEGAANGPVSVSVPSDPLPVDNSPPSGDWPDFASAVGKLQVSAGNNQSVVSVDSRCHYCQGPLWDNRVKPETWKAEWGEFKPAFTCKDKTVCKARFFTENGNWWKPNKA